MIQPTNSSVSSSFFVQRVMYGTAYHQKQISGHYRVSVRLCSIQICKSLWSAILYKL